MLVKQSSAAFYRKLQIINNATYYNTKLLGQMKYLQQSLSSFIFINLLFLSTINATELSQVVDPSNTSNHDYVESTDRNVKDTCLLGDCVSGLGVLLTNNQKLIGRFENRKLEGYGIIEYASGSVYVGQFKNGFRDGKGQVRRANKVIQGVWVRDKYLKSTEERMEGCKSGDCNNGEGVYIYHNSTVFMGSFSDGRANGFGLCFFFDGDIYHGTWANHTFHGRGTYLYRKNMTTQDGYWNSGQFMYEELATPLVTNQDNVIEDNGKSEIWAVVVGIAQYRHMQALRYTDDDAYAMNTFLRSPEGGAVKKSNIKVLIDEAATQKNILEALTLFAEKADANDVFMFYFSGHGLSKGLLPIDYEGKYSDKTLLHEDLVRILKSSKAKSKVVIADACYSGGMLAFKGADYETSMNNYYSEISKNKGGLVMILSSKAEETSIENNGLRQGIFSHFLMKGLYGAANTNNDELIRLDELFEYVQRNVTFYTNHYQTPIIYGDKSLDLPIGIIRE